MRSFKPQSVPLPRSSVLAPAGIFALEIGCGVGMHPLQWAKDNSDKTLVAIERTQEKFLKFERRWCHHGKPANLIPIHDDAVAWVTHRVPAHSLSHLFILYPNPEPKNKNQRLAHMPFVDFLRTRLHPEGVMIVATNIAEYAQECRTILPERGFRLQQEKVVTGVGRTHFERKYLARAQVCLEQQWQLS